MSKLKREDKIRLNRVSDNSYQVTDFNNGDVLLKDTDNYFIYFKNVNLRSDGTIEGRYLGTTDGSIIDGYSRQATFTDGIGYSIENVGVIRTARMVAIDNRNKTIIVIQNN